MTKPICHLFFVFAIAVSNTSLGGVWVTNTPLSEPRQGLTATLLFDGKVLIAGGFGISNAIPRAEVYDPAGGTWSYVSAMPIGRVRHTATMLTNGLVLVAGGAG